MGTLIRSFVFCFVGLWIVVVWIRNWVSVCTGCLLWFIVNDWSWYVLMVGERCGVLGFCW